LAQIKFTQAVTLLIGIWEVPVWNIGWDINGSDSSLSWVFLSRSRRMQG
jgi:hypothetical protein